MAFLTIVQSQPRLPVNTAYLVTLVLLETVRREKNSPEICSIRIGLFVRRIVGEREFMLPDNTHTHKHTHTPLRYLNMNGHRVASSKTIARSISRNMTHYESAIV